MAMSQAQRLKEAYNAQLEKQAKRQQQLQQQKSNTVSRQSNQSAFSKKQPSASTLGQHLTEEKARLQAYSTRQLVSAGKNDADELPRADTYRTEVKRGEFALISDRQSAARDEGEQSKTLPTTYRQEKRSFPTADQNDFGESRAERKARLAQHSMQLQQHIHSRSRSRLREIANLAKQKQSLETPSFAYQKNTLPLKLNLAVPQRWEQNRSDKQTRLDAGVNEHLVEETPSNLSSKVALKLQKLQQEQKKSSRTPNGDISEKQDLQSERLDSTFSTFELDQLAQTLQDPWKMTLGQQADEGRGAIETELIKRAGRTAQILLQDDGIKMTRPLRQKIISYQSDMGYQLLTKQVQGFIKLSIVLQQAQKRVAFSRVHSKDQALLDLGKEVEKRGAVAGKKKFIQKWKEALKWHRNMIKLSLRAHEHRRKGERLHMMLCLVNLRKVLKQEGKWLIRAQNQLEQLKEQRLFRGWVLEAKRRKAKRARQTRLKRYVILAMGAVLERENLQLDDYLYRKRLLRSLRALYSHARKKIVARGRLENARQIHQKATKRSIWHKFVRNVATRKEMKKDAISRQLLDEEPGADEFFCVQVRVQGTKTVSAAPLAVDSREKDSNLIVHLSRGEQTRVAIPSTVVQQVTLTD